MSLDLNAMYVRSITFDESAMREANTYERVQRLIIEFEDGKTTWITFARWEQPALIIGSPGMVDGAEEYASWFAPTQAPEENSNA